MANLEEALKNSYEATSERFGPETANQVFDTLLDTPPEHIPPLLEDIEDGVIDILFVNESELATLTGEDDFEAGVAAVAGKVPVLVATKGEHGAIAVAHGTRAEVAAEPVDKVVDTTGAGDQFAAGFLSGYAKDAPLDECLKRGAVAAAEVIAHYGPRPEADMQKLMGEKL